MTANRTSLNEIEYKPNLFLQIFFEFNVYLSITWSLVYGFRMLYNLSELWSFHGFFIITGYLAFVTGEYGRLRSGYSGNLMAKVSDLSTCLMLTFLIQFPILVFLFISANTQFLPTTIITAVILCVMIFEFIIGAFTCRKITYHQTELFRIKRQIVMEEQTTKKAH